MGPDALLGTVYLDDRYVLCAMARAAESRVVSGWEGQGETVHIVLAFDFQIAAMSLDGRASEG